MWRVEAIDSLGEKFDLYCVKGENNEPITSLLEYESARDIVAAHNFMLSAHTGNTLKRTSSILKGKT